MTRTEKSGRHSGAWLAAGGLWVAGGFAFPLLSPATAQLSQGLQDLLTSTGGMSGELAYYVAFTILRIPLTASLAALIAAGQCILIRGLPARRWIVVAASGACVATLIFLPTTLVTLQLYGDISRGLIRAGLLVVPGAGLLGGFVSSIQKRSVRKKVLVPGQYVAVSVAAALAGVLGKLLLE